MYGKKHRKVHSIGEYAKEYRFLILSGVITSISLLGLTIVIRLFLPLQEDYIIQRMDMGGDFQVRDIYLMLLFFSFSIPVYSALFAILKIKNVKREAQIVINVAFLVFIWNIIFFRNVFDDLLFNIMSLTDIFIWSTLSAALSFAYHLVLLLRYSN